MRAALLWACAVSALWARGAAHAARSNGLGPERVARGVARGAEEPSAPLRLGGAVKAQLGVVGEVRPVLDGRALHVTVNWTAIQYTAAGDWVGVFPCRVGDSECSPLDRYPVQYKETPNGKARSGARELSFLMLVRPGVESYRVAYVSPAVAPYPEVQAMTAPIPVPAELRARPSQVRLSLVSGDVSAMRFMWSERAELARAAALDSEVVVRHSPGGAVVARARAARTWVYARADLCEREAQPAFSVGWVPPGLQVEAVVRGLAPDSTYWYTIERRGRARTHTSTSLGGGDSYKEREFVTGPAPGSGSATRIVVFGDMGQSMDELDGSLQHSWDFHGRGEIAAPNTTRLVERLLKSRLPGVEPVPGLRAPATLVAHIGDISYATGALALWDSFLAQVEPLSSFAAYMTAIGNHEMGWRSSDVPGSDSQGECGRPYGVLYPFASQAVAATADAEPTGHRPWDQPWYVFEHGLARVVVMSTEHSFDAGSPQLQWIERQLHRTDRARTPWLLLMGHRPMYISSDYGGDHDALTAALQKSVGPLLSEYKVDIAMWGHHHSYQRSILIGGVQHVVVGTGGFGFSPIKSGAPDPNFVIARNDTWGVSLVDMDNATHARLSFLSATDASTQDDHWLVRDHTADALM